MAFLEYIQDLPHMHPLLANNSIIDQRVVECTEIDFSAFDALLEFLTSSPVVPPKMIEAVITGVVIIKAILIDPQELVEDEDGDLQVARSVVRNVGSFFYSFDLNKMNEYMGLQLCWQLCKFFRLLNETPTFQRLRVERPIILTYPKTSPFIFINHLLENLEELLKDTTTSTLLFNYFIQRVQSELSFWYSDLIEISSNPPLFLKETIETITILAYDVEYVLDSYLVGDVPLWRCICWLNDIFLDFLDIEQERKTEEDMEEDLKRKKTMIEEMLLGGDEPLNIITIVGPSGIGKKALAKELYNSPSVISHFESRAYLNSVYIDSHDEITDALSELLGQLVDLSDEIRSKNNEELAKLLLFSCLKGERFLVVINTFSCFNYWDKIQRWFPDSHNGSRIVLLTREEEFDFPAKSKSIGEPQSPPIWDSFFEIVSCPEEMKEVGMKIAKRCKPESKTFVVALLRTIRKTVNQWEEVAQTLGSRVFGLRGSQVHRILDLTCIYLPDHLRSCFLYMVLPFYEGVSVSEVIRLWIAEGFVKHTASQSLEETGEDYLADLISRDLLELSKDRNSYLKVACVYNPLVYNFLRSKVMEDNFLQIEYDESSSPTIYYQRRLMVSKKWDIFVMSSGPFLQSLLFRPFIDDDISSNHSCDISFIYNKFKFLRILKIKDLIIGESFIEVGVLVLLRYLAITSSVKFIPPSISNIWNLETFHFRQSKDEVVKVADCIWDMIKLRHIHIGIFSSFDLEPHRLENSSSILENLQTFSEPIIAYGDNMEKMLRRLSGIVELKCRFLDSWDDHTKCNQFPMLDFLNKLITLKVEYMGAGLYPCKFNFPSNLKKLSLKKFKMPWSAMLQLAMLKNLEALELKRNAFEGERWDMEDHVVFTKLKYLKLVEMEDLEYWNATRYHFPRLEHLFMYKCKKLVEIPQDFAYITSIHMIEVKFCKLSAEKSVRLIQDQHVKNWGHNQLKISCKYNIEYSGICRC